MWNRIPVRPSVIHVSRMWFPGPGGRSSGACKAPSAWTASSRQNILVPTKSLEDGGVLSSHFSNLKEISWLKSQLRLGEENGGRRWILGGEPTETSPDPFLWDMQFYCKALLYWCNSVQRPRAPVYKFSHVSLLRVGKSLPGDLQGRRLVPTVLNTFQGGRAGFSLLPPQRGNQHFQTGQHKPPAPTALGSTPVGGTEQA